MSSRGFIRPENRRPKWKYFWQGFPAVLVSMGVLILLCVRREITTSAKLSETYRVAAARALDKGDLAAAEVYFRKLAYLDPRDPWNQYGLALTAERKGDENRAWRMMSRIAPLEQGGYAPAHFWIARHLAKHVSDVRQNQLADHRRQIEKHVIRILESQPDNHLARSMLAKTQLAAGHLDGAAENFVQIVDIYPEFRLPLAKIYVLQGHKDLAKRQAELARDFYRQRLDANDDADTALQLASIHLFLEEFADAIDLLTASLSKFNDPRFRASLAALHIVQFDRTDPTNIDQKLQFLQKALQQQPDSNEALQRLAVLAIQEGKAQEEAQTMLEELLTRGIAPATTHFLLGTLAAKNGDTTTGAFHLQQAQSAQPATAEIANNLAWCLARQQPPQLREALKLIEIALQVSPENPEMHETRGQILIRLDRAVDSITDLELALQAFPNRPVLHQSLAHAYEKAGRSVLANKHRQRAAELSAKN